MKNSLLAGAGSKILKTEDSHQSLIYQTHKLTQTIASQTSQIPRSE